MHIVIIGAGVVGVTTAYALSQRGHRVTVIEQLSSAGQETSRANAGQRSYGYVYPWASPAMIKKALPWLLQKDGPLKMQVPPSLEALRFLFATWRYAKPGIFEANKRAMLQLAAYSRECFHTLETELPLAFDGEQGGVMELASDAASAASLQSALPLLREVGVPHRFLNAEETLAQEPALADNGPLLGALWLPEDGTGDCCHFSQALAMACEAQGVEFRYNTRVDSVALDREQVAGLLLKPADQAHSESEKEHLEADAFVLCAGTASSRLGWMFGSRLMIYPVKGYSLTAPLIDPDKAPRFSVIDDRFKVVTTRLGSRMRATGFVELTGMNRDIPEARLDTIRRAVASRFPGAADMTQAEPWAGFRPMTPDGPPLIGRGRYHNLYLNTGHGTFGWTLSAASAQLIAQLVDGETPAVSLDAFRPDRFD
ncbi:D-amino acid dehydrogenase [Nitrincola alkalilacustris]|uniref:D-amino acid dehydrogenase n=1 Tax=Nitrincola alkalilacustris TaxID=1571224 RepID=UPI00124EDB48|nr:D-amino acid dehydrogenase [Nitrincola alkalilacustris]